MPISAAGEDPAPKWRTFSAEYNLRIVAEYDAAPAGDKGAILRRERLYHSHVIEWRQAREAGALDALVDRRTSAVRPKKAAGQAELDRLHKKVARLEKDLARKDAALEVRGKGVPCSALHRRSATSGPPLSPRHTNATPNASPADRIHPRYPARSGSISRPNAGNPNHEVHTTANVSFSLTTTCRLTKAVANWREAKPPPPPSAGPQRIRLRPWTVRLAPAPLTR
ncbi:hypothetical protein ACFV98_28900 [Streptomyces violascens]|uniref:hypothetical protein n=1 Tax=Streptomyces violascens TaxID=67381 RepID=UPI00364645F4